MPALLRDSFAKLIMMEGALNSDATVTSFNRFGNETLEVLLKIKMF